MRQHVREREVGSGYASAEREGEGMREGRAGDDEKYGQVGENLVCVCCVSLCESLLGSVDVYAI